MTDTLIDAMQTMDEIKGLLRDAERCLKARDARAALASIEVAAVMLAAMKDDLETELNG